MKNLWTIGTGREGRGGESLGRGLSCRREAAEGKIKKMKSRGGERDCVMKRNQRSDGGNFSERLRKHQNRRKRGAGHFGREEEWETGEGSTEDSLATLRKKKKTDIGKGIDKESWDETPCTAIKTMKEKGEKRAPKGSDGGRVFRQSSEKTKAFGPFMREEEGVK